jgi:hypothetical protein
MTIWYILCAFGKFSHFGIKHQEKSGNPVPTCTYFLYEHTYVVGGKAGQYFLIFFLMTRILDLCASVVNDLLRG